MTLIQAQEVINGGVLRPAPMNARFDSGLIGPHIADAERAHIIPVIGEALYATLLSKKNTLPCNYNAALGPIVKAFPASGDAALESLWVDHLHQLTAWAVLYEALPFIGLQTGSAGVFSINTEHANNEGTKGIAFTQDAMRRRIDIKVEGLKAYLCANATDCPDYDTTNCPGTSCGESTPKKRLKRYGLNYVTND